MSRIKIRHFGPIRDGAVGNDGWIDIRKVTVFTGNQGSGKSTVGKMISTMTWIEKAIFRGYLKKEDLTREEFVDRCRYQNTHNYFKKNTEIEYHGNAYHIIYNSDGFSAYPNPLNGYHFPKIMYVPAERNFVSSVNNVDRLEGLPQTLYTFSDEWLNALRDFSDILDLPINSAKLEYSKESNRLRLVGHGYDLDLSEASSGFQSFVPLYVVSLYLSKFLKNRNLDAHNKNSLEAERRVRNQIQAILDDPEMTDQIKQEALRVLSKNLQYSAFINVVEEPELNLFPSSQRGMLNSLLKINNMYEGNKLIITTHSPYLINYLSIAVKADSLLTMVNGQQSRNAISEIVPLQSTVKKNDLAIYELNELDGTILLLEDINGIPSDENKLNIRLEESNDLYAQLLEIQQRYGS